MECDRSEEDFISEMPDEILSLILPYLTVKDAFKTRVLSGRWRHLHLGYLHASRSNLKFDSITMVNIKYYECHRNANAFVQKVNKFLNEYRGPNIGSFRVAFCLLREFALDIDRWINFAIKMGAEKLELELGCEYVDFWELLLMSMDKDHQLYAFSFQLLSEASKLKYLRLRSCILKPDFNGQFHSLDFLDLNVIPVNQSLQLNILSRCSNLERLRLSYCSSPTVLSVRSPFLRLKQLMIHYCKGLKEIELCASHLTNFELHSHKTANIVFSSVHNLEKGFCVLTMTLHISYLFCKLSNQVPQLQSLSVYYSVEMITHISRFARTFGNLKQLEFSLARMFYHDIRNFITILRACPVLQKFRLLIGPLLTTVYNVEERKMAIVDNCVHTQLKEVEIGGFCGSENQLELAAYILENAVALERMVLTSYYKVYFGFGEWRDFGTGTSLLKLPFDERKREGIVKLLEVKATSKAQLIVEKII